MESAVTGATAGRVNDPHVAPIVAVVGATAAGKSSLALDLAERLHGEIVNTDAMQVYRGMDIGTAKLPDSQRRGIEHHLLDLLDVTEPLSVADFQRRAREVIAAVRERGRTPVLVGGSALYVRAILDRFEFPGTDRAVRERLERELAEQGVTVMYARLAATDPSAAERIRPDNGRRIVRALEVVELTGRPFSASLPEKEYADRATIQLGVDIDRETLVGRIDRRVEQMYADGLVEEVASLLARHRGRTRPELRWSDLGRTAATAIGYREAAAYLAGELTRAEAIERTAAATRRFARRQDQWFRKDPRIVWLPWDAPDLADRALRALPSAEER